MARRDLREVRDGAHVASTAVVTAIACDGDGNRYVVGFDVVDTESYESWLGFLRHLRERGVGGTGLVVPTHTRAWSGRSARSSRAPPGSAA